MFCERVDPTLGNRGDNLRDVSGKAGRSSYEATSIRVTLCVVDPSEHESAQLIDSVSCTVGLVGDMFSEDVGACVNDRLLESLVGGEIARDIIIGQVQLDC